MDTCAQIEQIFREEMNIEVPSPSTDIIGEGLLDSLTFVTLLVELEARFSITIPPEKLDIEQLRTVEQMAALVESFTNRAERV